ncbi:SurA N-terminal domain-containing protein [Pseudalkalibacillus hwajinpoensis]|uniref:SurA N-terminal domain-containing protein n=1 Tax=Guptibacillus hwajinpoensis TaxID=208199 RepID=UPI00325AABDB
MKGACELHKLTYLLITGLLLVVLAACGGNEESSNDKTKEDTKTEEKSGEQKQPEVDKVDADKVVATVNDKEIKGEDFNALYSQSQMQYVQTGQEVPKEQLKQLKTQVAESMVGQELILQDAKDKGYEASDEQVKKELASLKEGYESEEKFEAALKKSDMSEEDLKKEIAKNIQYTTYIDKEIKVDEVTEEEMKKYYEQAKEQGKSKEMPAYEDVKPQIKKGLEGEQKQKKTQELIEKLKKDADVKINI